MGANASSTASNDANNAPPAAACPVDHKAREVWLAQNKNAASPHPSPPSDPSQPAPAKLHRPLSNDREVSTIPRALPTTATTDTQSSPPPQTSPYEQNPSVPSHGSPSNSESETGHDQRTGNWIYPSERQFFDALVRKNNTPASANSAKEVATSVASIIPIHNAVNERAWAEILTWEAQAPLSDRGSRKCGGPKLYSFQGLGVDGKYRSPRARLNGMLGYQLPFDRHDWVVERCGGERVEYLIDFYQGRAGGRGSDPAAEKLSFYLDVRPKLNSVEGCRMRMSRCLGL